MNGWIIRGLFLLLVLPALARAELTDDKRELIQRLFPSATVIGDKLDDVPVYPVYQLQDLLGYAYNSTDLSPLQGFAGKPIEMMIGLDVKGRFTGVEVLNHHEPVFLHGLGEGPMLEFIDQYTGRSLSDQIIVQASSSGKSGQSADGKTVYFDGVSKATVSVLIINDTILSSALMVARKKLEGFAQAAPTRARTDFYEPLTWDQLIERGYVQKATVSAKQVADALGRPLSDYPEDLTPGPGQPFSELYFAYMNAPMVGRNLLGDEAYRAFQARLDDRGKVMMVLSRGTYPHTSDAFVPGSTPSRIGLDQGPLAIEMRDLNWLSPDQSFAAAGMPDFEAINLFRVGGNAGFNPGAEATFNLSVSAPLNHLVTDSARFSLPVQFPGELFETVDTGPTQSREPVWVGLWKERWLQISLLIGALTVLTVFFARQKTLTRHPKWVHRFRWAFLFFTLFFIGFYAQGQLSVVNIYTLFLAIWDGFSLNVFLLDPIIFILWSYTFVTLFIWGRGVFCGWLCPFGALQEMAAWLGEKLKFRQIRVPERWHRRLILLKYPILLVLVGTAFYSLSLAEKLVEVEPFKTSITLYFWRYWPFVAYAVGLLVIGMFVHKFYCRYLCPLGAGLAVLGRFRLFSWLKRIDRCGSPCQHCKNACGINAIRKDGRIDYDECIQCLECVVILRDDSQCVDSIIRNKQTRKQARILATDASA